MSRSSRKAGRRGGDAARGRPARSSGGADPTVGEPIHPCRSSAEALRSLRREGTPLAPAPGVPAPHDPRPGIREGLDRASAGEAMPSRSRGWTFRGDPRAVDAAGPPGLVAMRACRSLPNLGLRDWAARIALCRAGHAVMGPNRHRMPVSERRYRRSRSHSHVRPKLQAGDGDLGRPFGSGARLECGHPFRRLREGSTAAGRA
jgi:hypothetical protein